MTLALAAAAGAARGNTASVAILSTTQDPARDIDMTNKILANAPFLNIDIIRVDTTTPSLAFVSSYSSLMVVGGDNPFQDPNGLGNMLASYLDAGHGVVMAGDSNILGVRVGGAFDSQNYWAIGPGALNFGTPLTLGTVYAPLSPLMANVTSFSGGSLSLWVNGGVRSDATRIADWSNGAPLVASWVSPGGGKEVALNFYAPSSDSYSTLWNANTDGGKLMANALLFTGGISAQADTPEPLTLMLSGIGLVFLGMAGRRRHAKPD